MVLRKATPREDIGRWRKAFRVGAKGIVWILVVAAAANIFGFAALADYLVRFVYISVYDALVLTTAARAVAKCEASNMSTMATVSVTGAIVIAHVLGKALPALG